MTEDISRSRAIASWQQNSAVASDTQAQNPPSLNFSFDDVSRLERRQFAAIKLAQVRTVVRYQAKSPDGLDVRNAAFAIAMVLNLAEKGIYKPRKRSPYVVAFPGLDIFTLRQELRGLDIIADDATVNAAIDFAETARQSVASILGLTKEVRRACKAWNLGLCVGETRAGRACERKKQDAERKKAERHANGSISRAEYEGNSLLKSKPWEAFGISQRTWYSRGKPVPS